MSRDSKVVIILIALILAVTALLVYYIRKPGSTEPDLIEPIPTGMVRNQAVTPRPTKEGNMGTPTDKPTPTPLLALGITPIVPERKPTDGSSVDGEEKRDGSTGEVIVAPDLLSGLTWSEDGVQDLSDLWALAALITEVYSEQVGVMFEGFPVGEEEYSIFDEPYAYYVDKYGFLHVNVRVVAEGYTDRYITGVVGYYGMELAVYDVEVVKE